MVSLFTRTNKFVLVLIKILCITRTNKFVLIRIKIFCTRRIKVDQKNKICHGSLEKIMKKRRLPASPWSATVPFPSGSLNFGNLPAFTGLSKLKTTSLSRCENIVENRKCLLPTFTPFSLNVFKRFLLQCHLNSLSFVKGLTLSQTIDFRLPPN